MKFDDRFRMYNNFRLKTMQDIRKHVTLSFNDYSIEYWGKTHDVEDHMLTLFGRWLAEKYEHRVYHDSGEVVTTRDRQLVSDMIDGVFQILMTGVRQGKTPKETLPTMIGTMPNFNREWAEIECALQRELQRKTMMHAKHFGDFSNDDSGGPDVDWFERERQPKPSKRKRQQVPVLEKKKTPVPQSPLDKRIEDRFANLEIEEPKGDDPEFSKIYDRFSRIELNN